jgi:hypothetical protein
MLNDRDSEEVSRGVSLTMERAATGQLAGESLRYTRLWKFLAWAMVVAVATLSLTLSPPQINLILWDKAQHTIAYSVLMWTFLQAWEGSHVLRWVTLLLTVGVGLELLQGVMGVRLMEYFDMLANGLGVLLGYAAWRTPLGQGFRRIEQIYISMGPSRSSGTPQ